MNQIKKILKEELSKRDQLRAKVKSLYLEELAKGKPSIITIKDMGFDYPGMEEDLRQVAIKWGDEGIQRMKTIKPSSEAEATFIKMFDGLYVDVWFEKYWNSIFFFKGNPTNPELWFELDDSWFYSDRDRGWAIFEDGYSTEYKDIQDLIRPLLEEVFRLEGVKFRWHSTLLRSSIEAAFKLKNQ